jgi:hypothetical protein
MRTSFFAKSIFFAYFFCCDKKSKQKEKWLIIDFWKSRGRKFSAPTCTVNFIINVAYFLFSWIGPPQELPNGRNENKTAENNLSRNSPKKSMMNQKNKRAV